MDRLPSKVFTVLQFLPFLFVKIALKVEGGAVWKIACLLWDNNSFIFKLLKDAFGYMLCTARIFQLYFAVTHCFTSSQLIGAFPVLATS